MITVNNQPYDWHEDLTVVSLLKELKTNHKIPCIIGNATLVQVNRVEVPTSQQSTWLIQNGDDIRVLLRIIGG